ncbi:MAG TPA: PAS domain S-box protein, partial [Methanomicrobiales archaeon]|nr:PAS domain S-box protein [Methanomicrobiales archaeon]
MQEETPPGEIRDIRARNQELESQVRELQETLDAIRSGEVDAIVVSKDDARRVYTLEGPDSPYRALVESISEGALTVSSEGMILYANARFASMSGVPPGQIPGTTILDYISPGDLPAFRTSFQGVPKGPCRGRVNLRLGSDSLPVSISMSPLSAEPGSKISVIVTDRREDAEALRESESVLRSFFDAPGDMRGIVEVVAGTDIRHVADNAVTAGFLGLKPEEMRNRLGSELGEPREILHRWIGHYEESRRMGKPVHFEYPDRRGEKEGWLSATVNYLGTNPAGEPRYAYVVRDITDQRQAEDALRRKQTEIQALFDNTPAGLVLFDADPKYRVLVHNRYYQELFAEPFRTRGMAGLSVVDYAPAVEAEGVVAAFDEVVRTKEPKSFLDFPYRSNPPKQSWFNWHMAPIIIDGKVVALVSMSLDVTDRHLAEQALRESEARFRALSETSSLAIGVSSFDGKFLYLNRAYERLFGYTLEE